MKPSIPRNLRVNNALCKKNLVNFLGFAAKDGCYKLQEKIPNVLDETNHRCDLCPNSDANQNIKTVNM